MISSYQKDPLRVLDFVTEQQTYRFQRPLTSKRRTYHLKRKEKKIDKQNAADYGVQPTYQRSHQGRDSSDRPGTRSSQNAEASPHTGRGCHHKCSQVSQLQLD